MASQLSAVSRKAWCRLTRISPEGRVASTRDAAKNAVTAAAPANTVQSRIAKRGVDDGGQRHGHRQHGKQDADDEKDGTQVDHGRSPALL